MKNENDTFDLPLTSKALESFAVAKVFKQNKKRICSMDFDDTGEFLVTASDDESICLYDVKYGKDKKVLYSKKYGIKVCKFAHTANSIIHSSTKEDDTIRYLSLHDNKYLRYFKGHKNRVISMEMSPVDDMFISGAVDDTVRLWDLRSPSCQGLVNVKGYPSVTIDHTGSVFAIALDNCSVRLYDLRNYEKGPFGMIPLSNSKPFSSPDDKWSGIKFSNNGRDLLISTRQEKIYIVDTIDYVHKTTLTGYENKAGLNIEACFTPDGKYVLSGSQDGIVHAWEVKTGTKIKEWAGHPTTCSTIAFNPRFLMFASACVNLAFWIPSIGWSENKKINT